MVRRTARRRVDRCRDGRARIQPRTATGAGSAPGWAGGPWLERRGPVALARDPAVGPSRDGSAQSRACRASGTPALVSSLLGPDARVAAPRGTPARDGSESSRSARSHGKSCDGSRPRRHRHRRLLRRCHWSRTERVGGSKGLRGCRHSDRVRGRTPAGPRPWWAVRSPSCS